MDIIDFGYDLKHGLAWIIVHDENKGGELTVQCCLELKNDCYNRKIIMSDCGHYWGNCGNINERAFKHWGENRCMKALFRNASQSDIEVI